MCSVLSISIVSTLNWNTVQLDSPLKKDSAAVSELIEKSNKGEINGTEDSKLSDPLFKNKN